MPFDGQITDFVPAETKPHVFSLDGLIAWLETQNGATEYEYLDLNGCMLAVACRETGTPFDVYNAASNGSECEQVEWVACAMPRTYAAALQRAYALRSE